MEEPNKKMKGIMHSNAFQSLDVDYLESLARNVGIDISAISASGRVDENFAVQSRVHSDNEGSPMSSLVVLENLREVSPSKFQSTILFPSDGALDTTRADNYEEEGEKWIEVIRKSRGKHPRRDCNVSSLF